MANRKVHALVGAGIGLAAAIAAERSEGEITWRSGAAIIAGAGGGRLPDILEPASRGPHHRDSFHSLAFGAALGYGLYRTLKWKPETEWQTVAKILLLAGCAGYLSHLVLDGCTPRGLPVI